MLLINGVAWYTVLTHFNLTDIPRLITQPTAYLLINIAVFVMVTPTVMETMVKQVTGVHIAMILHTSGNCILVRVTVEYCSAIGRTLLDPGEYVPHRENLLCLQVPYCHVPRQDFLMCGVVLWQILSTF